MKYKVGDVVKLRDDLEIDENYGGTVFTVLTHKLKHQGIKIIKVGTDYYIVEGENKIIAYASDEMIEGLWEEYKGIAYGPYEEKTNKYKLIDILNKIANGELKEGTKIKWDVFEYTYKKGDCYEEYLERKVDNFDYVDILDDMYLRNLNAEVELIEPHQFREDTKMIEELVADEINGKSYAEAISIIGGKLNEVIRCINKEE